MTVEEAMKFFENVPSVYRKISTLYDVGLSYIRLGQPSTELSGGEAQRIKLATELSRRGTGKTIYILDEPTNEYYEKGLRIIELYKHQFRDLNDIIGQIKNRNYKFIIYMDDLSFEDFETDYKYLKAVIEGGL